MKKVVIITGANGQLGRAVVAPFIEAGYHVIGLVRKVSDIAQTSGYEVIEVDLTDETRCQMVIEAIVKKYGNIHVAVLTAGGFAMSDLKSSGLTVLQQQYALNFETAYNIARPVMLQMLTQDKGRIFLIGSKSGLDVSKARCSVSYALSKSLLFRLAELFNGMTKGKNVVTSVVVPSVIDTPQNRSAMPDADFSSWVAPEDIANNIVYYCSDDADMLREPVLKIYNRS